jgi:hypothetical protein
MARKLLVCTNCYEFTLGTTITKGSIAIEIVLWLCFLIPGIIYSIWRLTTRHKACHRCGGGIIPADSPRGLEIVRQHHPA